MKYCKQETLVIETTEVLVEVKTVKLWIYSADRDISISNGVNVRYEKKIVFVLCFGGFFFFFRLHIWKNGVTSYWDVEYQSRFKGDSQKCRIAWDVY